MNYKSILLFLAILMIGILGIVISHNKYEASIRDFDIASCKLRDLKLNCLDLKKIGTEKKALSEEATQLFETMTQLQVPDVSTPQDLQDRLSNRISELVAKAKEAKVALPVDFYFGFDEYRSTLPLQDTLSAVNKELEMIASVVLKLIEAQVQSILSVDRRAPSLAFDPSSQCYVASKKSFDVRFVADHQSLRCALDSFFRFPHFVTLEALQIINPRSDTPSKGSKFDNDAFGEKKPFNEVMQKHPEKMVRLLFEKERLLVTVRIAMWTLAFPTEMQNALNADIDQQ